MCENVLLATVAEVECGGGVRAVGQASGGMEHSALQIMITWKRSVDADMQSFVSYPDLLGDCMACSEGRLGASRNSGLSTWKPLNFKFWDAGALDEFILD